ncbi:hypothetical protein TNCV_2970281 [Trichonephila clavipes]|nr:hypothetical protein TNCV_2970281 [Trichonephila clavipes]
MKTMIEYWVANSDSEACIKRILSSRLVSREWDNINRWGDGQVCPEIGQGIMAPWSRRPGIREEKSPALDRKKLRRAVGKRDLIRDWREKEGKTKNADGVEE